MRGLGRACPAHVAKTRGATSSPRRGGAAYVPARSTPDASNQGLPRERPNTNQPRFRPTSQEKGMRLRQPFTTRTHARHTRYGFNHGLTRGQRDETRWKRKAAGISRVGSSTQYHAERHTRSCIFAPPGIVRCSFTPLCAKNTHVQPCV